MNIIIKELQFIQNEIGSKTILNLEDIKLIQAHIKMTINALKMIKEFYEE